MSTVRSNGDGGYDDGCCHAQLYLQKVVHLEYQHTNAVEQVRAQAAQQRAVEEKNHQGDYPEQRVASPYTAGS